MPRPISTPLQNRYFDVNIIIGVSIAT